MKLQCLLTAPMSKRLIARGVMQHPVVKTALINGNIGICRGTTTSALASEVLKRTVEPFSYTTSVVLPPGASKPPVPETTLHDIIIRRGEVHTDGESVMEAAKSMRPGDVIVKGANALNYRDNIAGCLVGHPEGGTVGGFWGQLYGRKIRLVIPVGLEKETASDIQTVSAQSMDANPGVSLMPMNGIIITEIEAVALLTGAGAVQLASGGVRGAEGAVRLMLSGSPEQLRSFEVILGEIEHEPPF